MSSSELLRKASSSSNVALRDTEVAGARERLGAKRGGAIDPIEEPWSARWLGWFGGRSSSTRREIAEILARIDRDLPLAEARANRLLTLYRS